MRERTEQLGDGPVHWWEADGPPILWVHGVPNAGEMWHAFLERAGGVAVDLPGFGESTKRADLDFTLTGQRRFLERFLDHLGWERVRLVGHDWGGGFALAFAQAAPERVERVALVNSVPLLPGYRWHRVARLWRTKGVGELLMGSTNRITLRMGRRYFGLPEALDHEVLAHFDQGTQRAILRLYRASPEDALARAGLDLGRVTCPALVVWGDRDPYIAPDFAEAYASALGGEAEIEHLSDAGHWAWHDRPDVIDRIVAFLDA
jgi:pimeloyl-ACP methyl ester carboxylesterase